MKGDGAQEPMLYDHVIVAGEHYFSFAEAGLL
jgi:DNA repair protein RadC